jgi:hypothetical protein
MIIITFIMGYQHCGSHFANFVQAEVDVAAAMDPIPEEAEARSAGIGEMKVRGGSRGISSSLSSSSSSSSSSSAYYPSGTARAFRLIPNDFPLSVTVAFTFDTHPKMMLPYEKATLGVLCPLALPPDE